MPRATVRASRIQTRCVCVGGGGVCGRGGGGVWVGWGGVSGVGWGGWVANLVYLWYIYIYIYIYYDTIPCPHPVKEYSG